MYVYVITLCLTVGKGVRCKVFDWGTVSYNLKLRGFSWKHGITHFSQTDTGGRDENSKALERTRVKELGKMTP